MKPFWQWFADAVRAATGKLRIATGRVPNFSNSVPWRAGRAQMHAALVIAAALAAGHTSVLATVSAEGPHYGGCGGLESCSFRVTDPNWDFVWGVGSDMEGACRDYVQKRFNNWYPPSVWTSKVIYTGGGGYPPGHWMGTWDGHAQWGTGYQCQHIDSRGQPPNHGGGYILRLSPTQEGGYRCPPNSSYTGNGQCTCGNDYGDNPSGTQCIAVDEANRAEGGGCEREAGNPILPLTGSKVERVFTGLSLRAFNLVLTYDSARGLRPSTPGSGTTLVEPPALGGLWRSSYHRKLQVSVGLRRALLSRGDGRILTFVGDGLGTFTPDGYNGNHLASIAGGYRLTDVDSGSVETFNAAGLPTSIARIDGTVLTFTYSGEFLMSVQSGEGRTVRFAYSGGRISKITGPAQEQILIGHDANGQFSSITWPDLKTRTFVYENASFPWALTGILDESGARYATFGYDSGGRAVSTEHAGGAGRYMVSYAKPPEWVVTNSYDSASNTISRMHAWQVPQGTTIVTPSGAVEALEAQDVLCKPAVSSETRQAGSGSSAAGIAMTYDAAGNIASRDDLAGMRSCYLYDSKHRETVRVEGLPTTAVCASVTGSGAVLPAGARRIQTAWHPDWRLRAERIEPLRKTTFVYHGQPDPFNGSAIATCTSAPAMPGGKPLPLLCKRVEQALLPSGAVDSAVATSAFSFTYDSTGRVLSSVDPNSKATTFTYYAERSFSGGPYDPNVESVALLLHGNGTEGSTSIVNDAPTGIGVSAVGNARISASQAVFGGSAMAFDGVGDYLTLPSSDAFNFGAGDFTIEAFVYKNANNADGSRIWNPNADVHDGVALYIDPSGNFGAYVSTGGTSWNYSAPAVANLANGRWYHLAVVRSGGSVYAFVDGVRSTVTSALGNTALFHYQGVRVIGGQAGINRALNGYIDEFRVTKGVARYTSDFTPPALEFPQAVPGPDAVGQSPGDLASRTNPAGHVTRFDAYDPAGRPRQVTDAKGVVSAVTYTPRGWVSTSSTTVAGAPVRTTAYTYDYSGLLTGVSLPDGTSLTYSYDAAHRLTGVTDGRGNSITYTLDASGNRIGEDVKDLGGVLRRSVARSFDALNRVQQVTGAAE